MSVELLKYWVAILCGLFTFVFFVLENILNNDNGRWSIVCWVGVASGCRTNSWQGNDYVLIIACCTGTVNVDSYIERSTITDIFTTASAVIFLIFLTSSLCLIRKLCFSLHTYWRLICWSSKNSHQFKTLLIIVTIKIAILCSYFCTLFCIQGNLFVYDCFSCSWVLTTFCSYDRCHVIAVLLFVLWLIMLLMLQLQDRDMAAAKTLRAAFAKVIIIFWVLLWRCSQFKI